MFSLHDMHFILFFTMILLEITAETLIIIFYKHVDSKNIDTFNHITGIDYGESADIP